MCACGCVHSGLEKSWPDCSLGGLTPNMCVPGLSLNLESGSRAGVCSLSPTLKLIKRRRSMCLSPLTPPPGSGAAVWEAGAIPPLWSWLCGTQASRTLEAAGSRWHQTCHVCCTSLILAQAFPLPGNPVPALPYSAFKTECKCPPPWHSQRSPPPCSQREAAPDSHVVVPSTYSLLECLSY